MLNGTVATNQIPQWNWKAYRLLDDDLHGLYMWTADDLANRTHLEGQVEHHFGDGDVMLASRVLEAISAEANRQQPGG